MTTRSYLIVTRRGALSGRRLRALHAAVEATPGLRERASFLTVDHVRDVRDAAAGLTVDTVLVAAGGDGTVNMVAAASHSMAPPGPIIGVLPLGTGNAFAHAMGMSTMSAAVAALLQEHVRSLDLMETTHPEIPVALMSLSVGFEARFIRKFSRWRELSRPVAVIAGAAACAGRTADVTLTADGHELVDSGDRPFGAGLYNTRCYAFGRVVFPNADPGDGWAEAVAYPTAASYWRALLRWGQPDAGLRGVALRQWRQAWLETTGPIQVDGESRPGGAFEVRLVPGAVRAIAPQGPPTSGAMLKG